MQGLPQCIEHVICMIREMRVALNQAFVHGKQSGIVKRNVVFINGLCMIPSLVTTKPWHGVYNEFIVIFLSAKQMIL